MWMEQCQGFEPLTAVFQVWKYDTLGKVSLMPCSLQTLSCRVIPGLQTKDFCYYLLPINIKFNLFLQYLLPFSSHSLNRIGNSLFYVSGLAFVGGKCQAAQQGPELGLLSQANCQLPQHLSRSDWRTY